MWMALSVKPLHSIGQDDQNEVHNDFFDHVMSLALHNADGIHGKTAFHMSR